MKAMGNGDAMTGDDDYDDNGRMASKHCFLNGL